MATAVSETPYSALPLPNANEYPYNLQGDQTKARALAAAAQNGARGALEQLRTLGLDQNANLVAAPTAPAPAAPAPVAYRPTNPSRPAAQPAQPSANYDRYKGANTDALVKEYKDGYGSAQDRAALRSEIERRATRLKDPAAAQAIGMAGAGTNAAQTQPQPGQPSYAQPAGPAGRPQPSNYQSPRTTLQQQAQAGRANPEQLKREAAQAVGGIAPNSPAQQQRERDFQESKRRFDEQTAMAKQRMQFEQEMARTREANNRQIAKDQARNQRVNGAQQPAAGRGPAARRPAGASANKQKAQNKPASKGRGGGGGRGEKSPEQKARDKARFEDAYDRASRSNDRRQDRRDLEREAKIAGYNNVRAYKDAQAREDFRNRSRVEREDRNAAEQERLNRARTEGKGRVDKILADRQREKQEREQKEKASWERQNQEGWSGSQVSGGRRMVHAYGNKYAKLVQARGDLA